MPVTPSSIAAQASRVFCALLGVTRMSDNYGAGDTAQHLDQQSHE